MFNLNLTAFQSQEFIVGIAVAAIMVCALCASSMFRNLALALAAGGVVLLYLQGGVPALVSTSEVLEKEIRALPDFFLQQGRGGDQRTNAALQIEQHHGAGRECERQVAEQR